MPLKRGCEKRKEVKRSQLAIFFQFLTLIIFLSIPAKHSIRAAELARAEDTSCTLERAVERRHLKNGKQRVNFNSFFFFLSAFLHALTYAASRAARSGNSSSENDRVGSRFGGSDY